MNDPAPKRLAKKRFRGPAIAVAVVAAVLALVAGGYFGLCAWVQGNGLLLPGTTVTGLPGGQSVDLSGLDANAAARLLEQRQSRTCPAVPSRSPMAMVSPPGWKGTCWKLTPPFP